jgi:glycosyltransferase involved in cell wall biosynthesis
MCADLAIALAELDLRSVVVGLDKGGQLQGRLAAGGVEFVNLGGRRMLDARYHAKLARVLRELTPTAVHSHGFAPLLYAAVARALSGFPRLVHTEHSIEYLLPRPDYRRTLRWLSRSTGSFVVLGERMRRYYADEIGVAASRLRVIPNGVAVDAPPTRDQRLAARAALGLGDGFLVATVGRLAQEKNYSMLLGAFAAAMRDDPQAHLLFVGDGPERQDLERRAEALGITSRVHFPGWRTDVSALLPAFDVFAMSSFSEGLPMALLEAMSAGLAVVSTQVGDIPEVIADGRTGRLAPSGDEATLARVLADLRGDEVGRRRLGHAARELVVQRYSRTAMVEAYLETYGALTRPAATA